MTQPHGAQAFQHDLAQSQPSQVPNNQHPPVSSSQPQPSNNPVDEVVASDVNANPYANDGGAAELQATAWCEVLGREITFTRPDEVSWTFFMEDMNSKRLTQSEKMGVSGDLFRDLLSEDDFYDWRRKQVAQARQNPASGGAAFFTDLALMTEMFAENIIETDEGEIEQAKNRAERRAALRAKDRAERKQSN